jgi:hypothetical protein
MKLHHEELCLRQIRHHDDQIRQDEMDVAYVMDREIRNVRKITIRKPEVNYSEDIGVDRRIILKWILKKQSGREFNGFKRLTHRRSFVNTAMNPRVP